MRLMICSLVLAGTVGGVATSVFTYQAVSGGETRPAAARTAPRTPPTVVKVRLLPCERGTTLVKDVCVQTRHRVVIKHAPARSTGPISLPVFVVSQVRTAHLTSHPKIQHATHIPPVTPVAPVAPVASAHPDHEAGDWSNDDGSGTDN
jgi:hypothetical protein